MGILTNEKLTIVGAAGNDRLQYGSNSYDDETHSEYLSI